MGSVLGGAVHGTEEHLQRILHRKARDILSCVGVRAKSSSMIRGYYSMRVAII